MILRIMIKFSTFFTAVLLIFFSLFSKINAQENPSSYLQKVAEQYVLAVLENQKVNYKVSVKAYDIGTSRDYNKCEGFLTAQLTSKEISNKTSVKIVCHKKDNEFTLYVPVKVTKLVKTVIAMQNLNRGSTIGPDDISEQYIDANDNLSSAVSDIKMLLGAKVKQNIKEGSQIKEGQFCTVCKGDKVTINASSKGLSLKTSGEALEDGIIGSNIKVKNGKTKKVIYATILDPNNVQINL